MSTSYVSVTLTPDASCALSKSPSVNVMLTVGMVTEGLLPPRPIGVFPATLLTMTAAIAPADCACSALLTNVQEPRSMSAMLPAT